MNRQPFKPGMDRQVHLPLRQAVSMSARGISNRLGRSSITLFGVVLGTAFLMSVFTGSQLNTSLRRLDAERRIVSEVAAQVALKLGGLDGRCLGVIVGEDVHFANSLIKRLTDVGNVTLFVYAPGVTFAAEGVKQVKSAEATCEDADALLLINRPASSAGASKPVKLPAGIGRLREKVVMDFAAAFSTSELRKRGLFYSVIRTETEESAKTRREESAADEAARALWLLSVSLLVSGIGIANALLMSVTERFREIGTLKCLGALNTFVIQIFLWESAFIGLTGSALGILFGFGATVLAAAKTYGLVTVWENIPFSNINVAAVGCLIIGVIVSVAASVYPAVVAARMVPADAMRTEV